MVSRNTNGVKNTKTAVEQSDVIPMRPVTTLSRQSYCYSGMQQVEMLISACSALGHYEGGA